MSALAAAMARADRGLAWDYPCLVWVADYLRDATGRDPAAEWRAIEWSQDVALTELQKIAAHGVGDTDVERALDAIGRREGWVEATEPHQGAVMVGVFEAGEIGVPAIFDGGRRWIVSNDGKGWRSMLVAPKRMWEIVR